MKESVEKTKLIQLGITLCDEEGQMPAEVSAWQFNLKFDLEYSLLTAIAMNHMLSPQ